MYGRLTYEDRQFKSSEGFLPHLRIVFCMAYGRLGLSFYFYMMADGLLSIAEHFDSDEIEAADQRLSDNNQTFSLLVKMVSLKLLMLQKQK